MNSKPILIITGEPFGIFSEILFKTFQKKKIKKPIVVIASIELLKKQLKYLNYKISFNLINENFKLSDLKKNKINVINVNFKFKKIFDKISNSSNIYIKKCFDLALELINKNLFVGLINGPISKKHFLKFKTNGITEYLAKKTKTKNFAMLIYNKELSVTPITTHVPLKNVSRLISKKKIVNQVKLIKKFYLKFCKKNPKIAITGLNPHCESKLKNNEEERKIKPAIKYLKKKSYKVNGPYPTDSLFMKNNIKNFDVVVGMYHDQVLTAIKSLYNFNAINITLGLPFIRISPDHGPNDKMAGKNISNPDSLIYAIKFFEKK